MSMPHTDAAFAAAPDLVFRECLTFRAMRKESREVDFVASTAAIDSYGESVAQNWRLERYLANPVVLFAHNSRDLPIGQCSAVSVEDGQLVCRLKLATADANPLAEQVWQSIIQGTLRAVSVGFKPHTVRMEVQDDNDVWILDDNELYEISVVPVPANPEALARAKTACLAAKAGGAQHAAVQSDPFPSPRERESNTTTSPAASGTEKSTMTIEQLQALLDAEKAKTASLTTEKTALEANATGVTAKAKELEVRLATLDTEAKAKDATITQLKAVSETFDGVVKAATLAMKALPKPAKKDGETVTKSAWEREDGSIDVAKAFESLVDEMVDREVETLVGEKLTPAMKPDFVKLAKTGRDVFDSLIKSLPKLGLTGRLIKGAIKETATGTATKRGDEDLGELFLQTNAASDGTGDVPDLGDLMNG